jgi:hypothetical protein
MNAQMASLQDEWMDGRINGLHGKYMYRRAAYKTGRWKDGNKKIFYYTGFKQFAPMSFPVHHS